ncbi:MAG: hypothetical protein ACLQVG_16940 [Terriglobia bacterium]
MAVPHDLDAGLAVFERHFKNLVREIAIPIEFVERLGEEFSKSGVLSLRNGPELAARRDDLSSRRRGYALPWSAALWIRFDKERGEFHLFPVEAGIRRENPTRPNAVRPYRFSRGSAALRCDATPLFQPKRVPNYRED